MKTAERILLVSLELFNQHGEANVSSVDIAMELDISPGNLYYHFKGKEVIIAGLANLYQQRMSKILLAPENDELSLEEFFFYLFVLFEASHQFRFLYRNPAEISEKYPQIAKNFRKILASKEKLFEQCIKQFVESELVIGGVMQQKQIVELIGLIGTQTPNYQLLKGAEINDGRYIKRSIMNILFVLAPYMNIEKQTLNILHHLIDSHSLE